MTTTRIPGPPHPVNPRGWQEARRCLAGALLLLGCGGFSPRAGAAGTYATGITEPVADVVLSASVPGIVSRVRFKEGDTVKTNDVILELDRRTEELEVERRKAALDSRKSELDALQTLAARSSISVKKDDLDKAETEFRIARTEHEMAIEQLRKRSVTSSCDGVIVELGRDAGEACQAYQPLLRVVDTRQCYFTSNIDAKLAGRLKSGQKVKLEIESAASVVPVEGTIVYLAPVVDPASGLQRVKVLFDNAEGKIHPGVAGRIQLE